MAHIHIHRAPARRPKLTADVKTTDAEFKSMSLPEQIEVLKADGRSSLLRDCRIMGITANKIEDITTLATLVAKELRKRNAGTAKDSIAKTADCACGGHAKDAKVKDGDTTQAAKLRREYEIKSKAMRAWNGIGSAPYTQSELEDLADRATRASLTEKEEKERIAHEKSYQLYLAHEKRVATYKPSARDSSRTIDAAPVNLLYLDLDAMSPASLDRAARAKSIDADSKTDRIMGILRASFTPAQVDTWAQTY